MFGLCTQAWLHTQRSLLVGVDWCLWHRSCKKADFNPTHCAQIALEPCKVDPRAAGWAFDPTGLEPAQRILGPAHANKNSLGHLCNALWSADDTLQDEIYEYVSGYKHGVSSLHVTRRVACVSASLYSTAHPLFFCFGIPAPSVDSTNIGSVIPVYNVSAVHTFLGQPFCVFLPRARHGVLVTQAL